MNHNDRRFDVRITDIQFSRVPLHGPSDLYLIINLGECGTRTLCVPTLVLPVPVNKLRLSKEGPDPLINASPEP